MYEATTPGSVVLVDVVVAQYETVGVTRAVIAHKIAVVTGVKCVY